MSGIKFALTQAYQCNYLEHEKEQLLVCIPPMGRMQASYYDWLITEGFRRSGEQIYRPHCANCSACKSVRILVDDFIPSRSQKRVLKKADSWQFQFSENLTEEHYSLYEKYINERHAEGTMHPPSRNQFEQFVACKWHPPQLLEARVNQQLVAVAVTDVFTQALSALYTFFDPDFEKYSPGNLMILQQLHIAKQQNKPYVYLGYQVDACRKMTYKNKYLPQEQFINGKWTLIHKI